MPISEPMSSSPADDATTSDGLPTSAITTGTSSEGILELQILMASAVMVHATCFSESFLHLFIQGKRLQLVMETVPQLSLPEQHLQPALPCHHHHCLSLCARPPAYQLLTKPLALDHLKLTPAPQPSPSLGAVQASLFQALHPHFLPPLPLAVQLHQLYPLQEDRRGVVPVQVLLLVLQLGWCLLWWWWWWW